jgi:extracellular matrix regulatory protein B
MFIHIGNGNVIWSKDVVAIIDHQIISSSVIMGEMIQAWKKEKKIIGPTSNAKSVIITKDEVYYTTVSVSTLKKRTSITQGISNEQDFSDEISL